MSNVTDRDKRTVHRTVRVQGGKEHEIYESLLDRMHKLGIASIDTELDQIPNEDNGNVAVVKAVVETGDGRIFSGIGDASPANVTQNIVPHIIRMAETRAKARAYRDALNIGGNEFEEEAPQGPAEARHEAYSASESTPSEADQRSALINELSDLATKLNYSGDTIRATIQTRWMNEDILELERSASRMRTELAKREKEVG